MGMINLLYKEVLSTYRYGLLAIIYVIIFSLNFSSMGTSAFGVCTVASYYLILNATLAYDDKYKADIMFNILPVTRQLMVYSKFVYGILSYVFITLVYAMMVGIVNQLEIGFHLHSLTLKMWASALLMISIFNLLAIPATYLFGYMKLRYILMGFFFAFFSLTTLLQEQIIKSIDFLNSMINNDYFTIFVILIALLITYIGMMISLKIYKKKEF